MRNRVPLRRSIPFHQVELRARHLALAHGRLAVLGDVVLGCRVVVDAVVLLECPRREREVREPEVGEDEGRAVVVRGGAEEGGRHFGDGGYCEDFAGFGAGRRIGVGCRLSGRLNADDVNRIALSLRLGD